MTYCSPANVRLLVETPLTDAEITTLIEESDAEINECIGAQDASNALVRRLSALITAKTIRSTHPSSVTAGEYHEESGSSLGDWTQEIRRIYRLLTKPKSAASSHRFIDDEKRYPEAQ